MENKLSNGILSECEVVDENREFFAPVSSDVIDGLLGQYQQKRGHIEQVAQLVAGDAGDVVDLFIKGNGERVSHMPSVGRLFAASGAIAALNSDFWSRAMNLTDVYNCMPQARRDEWSKSIREMTAPEFTEEAVLPTIAGLLADRAKFFAERVDGIFRGLSGEHVTNRPEGFSKRMIIAYVTSDGYSSNSRAGLINDLRAVIAKFMGRDEPSWNATSPIVSHARQHSGEWITVDGGALRIRCYKVGTAHLEVHPDIAYRLNQVLAGLYPRAIPAEFRSKPVKKHKEFQLIGRPLPFAVVALLNELQPAKSYSKDLQGRTVWTPIANAVSFRYGSGDSASIEEAKRVLVSIGGVTTKDGNWQFDYAPELVIKEIVCSGCLPDVKTHQYYPTPAHIARRVVELADIGMDDAVLEPSAGQGALVDALEHSQHAICVEASKLHCEILGAKHYVTIHVDFLEWAASTNLKFERVVMNPPFSDGRALAHLQTAATLVKPTGRIVAVLPASLREKEVLIGWDMNWSEPIHGEFAGTSVSVVILSAAPNQKTIFDVSDAIDRGNSSTEKMNIKEIMEQEL